MRLEVAAWNLFRQGDLGFGQVVIDSRDNLDDLDHANGHGTDNPIDVLGDCRSIHALRLFSPKPAFIVALFSSNLPDFFFYEMEEETDKPNSEAIDLFRSIGL